MDSRVGDTNGNFIVLRDKSNKILFGKYGVNSVSEFNQMKRSVSSMALSDNGVLVIGYQYSDHGLVEVYDTSSASSHPTYTQVWTDDFGNGVAITPDARIVVVGSPRECKVYLYELNQGKFTSEQKITNREIPTFGWKVSISTSGRSLAISAPRARDDSGLDVGLIVIYNFIDDKWVKMKGLIKGRNEDRKLGLGGVAINEKLGRVYGMDQNGIIYTYQVRLIDCHVSYFEIFPSFRLLFYSTKDDVLIFHQNQLVLMETCLIPVVNASQGFVLLIQEVVLSYEQIQIAVSPVAQTCTVARELHSLQPRGQLDQMFLHLSRLDPCILQSNLVNHLLQVPLQQLRSLRLLQPLLPILRRVPVPILVALNLCTMATIVREIKSALLKVA